MFLWEIAESLRSLGATGLAMTPGATKTARLTHTDAIASKPCRVSGQGEEEWSTLKPSNFVVILSIN